MVHHRVMWRDIVQPVKVTFVKVLMAEQKVHERMESEKSNVISSLKAELRLKE